MSYENVIYLHSHEVVEIEEIYIICMGISGHSWAWSDNKMGC